MKVVDRSWEERLIMMMMIHCAGNVSKQFVLFRQTIHNFSMVFHLLLNHDDDFHFYSMKCELIISPLQLVSGPIKDR